MESSNIAPIRFTSSCAHLLTNSQSNLSILRAAKGATMPLGADLRTRARRRPNPRVHTPAAAAPSR
eukprot:1184511-Prorocentrum_minimum.AAC.5